jgi:hypothetical protein
LINKDESLYILPELYAWSGCSRRRNMNLLAAAGLIWAFLLVIGFEMKGGTLILLGFLIIAGFMGMIRDLGGMLNVLF